MLVGELGIGGDWRATEGKGRDLGSSSSRLGGQGHDFRVVLPSQTNMESTTNEINIRLGFKPPPLARGSGSRAIYKNRNLQAAMHEAASPSFTPSRSRLLGVLGGRWLQRGCAQDGGWPAVPSVCSGWIEGGECWSLATLTCHLEGGWVFK